MFPDPSEAMEEEEEEDEDQESVSGKTQGNISEETCILT